MVLETILSPRCARKQPYKLLFVTMLFFSAGVLVYLAIPGLNGTPLIFTLLPFMPLMFRMLIWEEKEEEAQLRRHESGFFDYHKVLLESYAYIFVGAILASMIWYGVLMQVSPEIAHNAFENEVQEIVAISNTVNQSSASTANVLRSDFFDFFGFLFGHNIQVLALMLLFSLLYGVGSLYLLLWNASVIGIFIAQRVFELGIINGLLGSFLGLLPHGMFELSAYFVASIAGGIFSVAVMRRHLERPELRKVLLDSFFLLLLSVGLVFIGALIESSY
ncbi:MAG: stage II sporulation protein M [Candidatus Micrarchaeia archaeon]